MTIFELSPMLERLGFDTKQLPICAGSVSLSELEYDEVDNYWHFCFGWRDVVLPVSPDVLPKDVWKALAPHASVGKGDINIFGRGGSSAWDGVTPTDEVEAGLRKDIGVFTATMLEVERLVAPWTKPAA